MPEFIMEELRGIKLEPENIVMVETYDDDLRLVYVIHKTKGGLRVAKIHAAAVDFIDRADCDPREFFTIYGKTSTNVINARYVDRVDKLPTGDVQIALDPMVGPGWVLAWLADLDGIVAKLETCRQYIKQKDQNDEG